MQLHTSINLRASPPAYNSGTLTEARNHTIVVYNDFNLDGVLGDVMGRNRQYSDYANADTEWAAYQNAVSAGFALLQGNPDHTKMFANVNAPDGSENAYYTAVQNIEAAIAALDAKAVTDTAKLATLETVVDTYRDVDPDDYVLFTYDRFEDAYDRAANIVNSQVAPEGEEATFVAPAVAEFDIVYAKAQLELWGGRLLKKVPVKTYLAEALSVANGLVEANYTAESWAAFKAARDTAITVNSDNSATLLQTTINDARIDLLKAQYDLVTVSVTYITAKVNTVTIDNTNNYILGVDAEKYNILDYIAVADGYTVNPQTTTPLYISTGTTFVIKNSESNNDVATYTAVVYGDISGDGQIDSDDQETLYTYLSGDSSVITSGTAQYVAADIDKNGSVTVEDYEDLFGPFE